MRRTSRILASSVAVIAAVTLVLILSSHWERTTSNPTTPSDVAVNNTPKPEQSSNPLRSTSSHDSQVQQASLAQSQDSPQKQAQSDLHIEKKITEDSAPEVMTDYQQWTVIAEEIYQNDNQSFATGNVGIAHRDGLFAVANEGIITHTNASGSVDSIYLSGEASIEIPGGLSMTSTDAELATNPEGNPTIRAKKLEVHIDTNITTTIYYQ